MKIRATEYNNALLPFEGAGNTVKDSVQVCKWLEEAGVDALHVSTGSSFPHPQEPGRRLPGRGRVEDVYDAMLASGVERVRQLPDAPRRARRRKLLPDAVESGARRDDRGHQPGGQPRGSRRRWRSR